MRTTLLIVLATLVGACNEPVGPVAGHRPAAPALAGAVTGHGSGILPIYDLIYLDCVGEDVLFEASVPFRYHLATTPGGRTLYLEPFVPNSGTGVATGQTSGTVWTLARVVSPLVLQLAPTRTFVHFTAQQLWVSDTGPDMHLFSRMHVVLDAEGNVVADKSALNRCIT